ncbi:E3 ubiquitin-protein ligase MIB2 [Condylostylus longicornis]|uniref:E3 ubiquitin-protein ligase MIB2 n=1 Tax=Condylostylus longicornis TaxID=2530218 RepID=UPI00244E02C1|nr:E3 ubiquitin-protein ligase MIB2 [Condylostylus longicornis]
MAVQPGIRVVRGPDWIWQNQDDGEGHVGTVCEIGRYGSAHSPEKTVVVNWDSGPRTNYRIGYQGQYDLIIVDNAQIGVRHSNVVCDGCYKGGIAGIVFKCAQCSNYYLCSFCYGNDVHDTEHSFIRYTTPQSLGVRVTPRKGVTKTQLKGIFVGAKVVRGSDWEWGQQDGGEGKTGRVMEIRGWDNESCRSVANVSWVTGSTNVYRLGHKGNVDLRYVTPTTGGYYYKDHMPILGQTEEQQPVISAVKPVFSVGDRVKVCLEVDALMKLQQGHGGWNPRMVEHLGKVGIVHRITEKGDIRVQYENCPNRWTFHPAALVKVCSFRVGDLVTIITDVSKVQQLQKGHGEWIEPMKTVLGKTCKVVKVYSDGDLRIQQLDAAIEWTLNPKCVKLERPPLATAAERSNSMMDLSHQRSDHIITPLSGLSGSSSADKLVREAAQGHFDFVKQYLEQHPNQVDVMSGGKTCLQVAAHQGHVNLVRFLINSGANVNVIDKEGDSTLHYAAFGNQAEAMRILLENNAKINFLNASHCSALHICAHKKTPDCIRILLAFGVNVNIQDSYGDTALHDAIGKENSEVVDLICSAPNLDFTVRNNRGFNVLHHASLKGNVFATKRILQLARQLVNVKKDDGFAALHLAALNGHSEVVEALILHGAEIDIRNNRRQTPFLLAVSQGHSAAIEKLVKLGCNINAMDEDGDNALHLCVIKKTNFQHSVPSASDSPEIYEIYNSLENLSELRFMYAILCYLSKKGCKIEANNKGSKIFDWVHDKDIQKIILNYQAMFVHEATPSTSDIQPVTNNGQAMNLPPSGGNISLSDVPSGSTAESSNFGIMQNIPTPAKRKTASNTLHKNNLQSTRTIDDQSNVNSFDIKNLESLLNRNQIGGNDNIGASNIQETESTYVEMTPTKSKISNNDEQSQGSTQKPTNNQSNISGKGHTSRKQASLTENISSNLVKLSPVTSPSLEPKECIVCNETLLLIIFEPCMHQISCEECGIRMKKCLSCQTLIEKRLNINGKDVTKKNQTRIPSADRLRYLENKIQEFEESRYCSICMERNKDVAFLCGHGACSRCAETLRTCHMCRKTIVKKINLY